MGIPVRVGDYKRIALALQNNNIRTRRHLCNTLMVLLAKNEHQAKLIQRQFDRYFSFAASTEENIDQDLDIKDFLKDLQDLEKAPDKPFPQKIKSKKLTITEEPEATPDPESPKQTVLDSFPTHKLSEFTKLLTVYSKLIVLT